MPDKLTAEDQRTYRVGYVDGTTDQLRAAYFQVDQNGHLASFKNHEHRIVFAARMDRVESIRDTATEGPESEPEEIRHLPAEVRALAHAVDEMLDNWAEADDARKQQLWKRVHNANDWVWRRGA